jgi:hypothetical protein
MAYGRGKEGMMAVELVGLDVNFKYVKPGMYVTACYPSEEASAHTPFEWAFRLEGTLQVTQGVLRDTGSTRAFGVLTDNGWRITFRGAAGQTMKRVFSDITVCEIREE